MRAVVISDSHGDAILLNKALERHKDADMVIFLGDGEHDFFNKINEELLKDKKVVAVCGNCDFYSDLPKEQIAVLGSKRIFCLHGHTKGVKYGLENLIETARDINADIVVYGHTHNERVDIFDGIYYMCPGSVRNGAYGIIDIDDKTNTVLCYIARL